MAQYPSTFRRTLSQGRRRFSVRDVAPDRLFVYLHELQREALFAARPDSRESARRGVRLVRGGRPPQQMFRVVEGLAVG